MTCSQLLHELQVHQIELETQNENLRRAQLELEESRDRYRDLYDFSPVGYMSTNLQGLITSINLTGSKMLGIERKRLINQSVARYFTGAKQACLLFDLQRQENSCLCEQQIRRPDGVITHVHLHCERTESGLSISVSDITTRHQAELMLRESEEKYHAIFEGTLDGVVLVDDAGFIVDCNPEFMRQTGYTLPQLKERCLWELRPPEKRNLARTIFQQAIEAGQKGQDNFKYKQPDGNVISVEARASVIRIGKRRYLQCITRDITAQLRADTLLRESEEKLRIIFDGALDGILLLDVENQKFSSANAALCRMLGYTADEIPRLALEDVHPAEDMPWIRAEIGRHVSGHTQLTVNIPMQRRDGTVFFVDIRSSPVTLGERVYLAGIVHDTSERRQRENELREYQQLLRELASQGAASREAELKHIAREVHDELGQLLTALRMDISLLRIQFGVRDPALMEKIQDMLLLVDKSIQGVRDVTTNLRPPALDMGIVSAIEWLGSELSDRAGVACRLHIEGDPTVLDDVCTQTLFRIAQESLTNVLRHAQAENVDITLARCADDITLEIRDDGKGLDLSTISAKKSFGLMGMRERALAIHGEVKISSSSGRGTVVLIRIPLSHKTPGRRSDD